MPADANLAEAPGRSTFVEDRLERYQTLTVAAILGYIPDKEPRRHLYDLVSEYPLRPGKGLRPGLCIATCRAFGGPLQDILRCAATLEMCHNAFLIHDDVEDESEHRRGLPTVNFQHGIPLAVNVGDALNVLSIRPLMDSLEALGPDLTLRVFEEVEHMLRESVEGQAIELGWIHDNELDLSEQDYLRMTLKKTCWYTCVHPCRIGALVATRGECDLTPFNEFGFFMGAAFQIQDDLLNLVGRPNRHGKEIAGDIWEGKRTLMLIQLARTCTNAERRRLHRFLASPRSQRKAGEVAWVLALMHERGSIAHARRYADALAVAAGERFDACYGHLPESTDKRLMREIVRFMVERDL
jgi:geranylgeranyl diphosphate synthase, type II